MLAKLGCNAGWICLVGMMWTPQHKSVHTPEKIFIRITPMPTNPVMAEPNGTGNGCARGEWLTECPGFRW